MKNSINIHNYEEYILDFVENTLSQIEHDQMLSLMNLHPDIADEVLSFRNLKLPMDSKIHYPNTSLLLKTPPKTLWFNWKSMMLAASLFGIGLTYLILQYQGEAGHVLSTDAAVVAKVQAQTNQLATEVADTSVSSTATIEPTPPITEEKALPAQKVASRAVHTQEQRAGANRNAKVAIQRASPTKISAPIADLIVESTAKSKTQDTQVEQVDIALVAEASSFEIEKQTEDVVVIADIETLPLLDIKPIDTKPNPGLVFVILTDEPKSQIERVFNSSIVGTIAFTNTEMSIFPTFFETQRRLFNK